MYLSLNVFTRTHAQKESLLTGNDKIKRGREKRRGEILFEQLGVGERKREVARQEKK